MRNLTIMLMFFVLLQPVLAHDNHDHKIAKPIIKQLNQARVTYLGNEALLIEKGKQKFLFDPFFSHDFGIYQRVPNDMLSAMKNGKAPFDGITAIFISHAHRDHFDANTMVTYLALYPNTALYASQQAIEQVHAAAQQSNISLSNELVNINLKFGDKPWQQKNKSFAVNAVRIPHAGWPARAEVENLVFSLTLNNGNTIMHMGDADADDEHYFPFYQHWQDMQLDVNFPPYWFMLSAEGRDILQSIGAKENIGVHVPVQTPKALIKSGSKFFSQPGEKHHIN